MSRIIYVNGAYLPYAQAQVHAEDRGFQFADAVYEVCEVRDGMLVDEPRHLNRLNRSLGELDIPEPMSQPAWRLVIRETLRRNRVVKGLVYLQVSRGAGRRNFLYPASDTPPTVVVLARSTVKAGAPEFMQPNAIAVKTVPDIRWRRRDIKTVMLLPAAMAKEAAKAEGAREAWLFDENGNVTEGASSNAWIITGDNRIITRQADNDILRGVTRTTLLDAIAALHLELEERPFTVAEAKQAKEAFITAATNPVTPVVKIDDVMIGDGKPGPATLNLRANLHLHADISA